MITKNFPGFMAVKNFAPFEVEFMWNSVPYIFDAHEEANLPQELAYAAIKGTIYKIEPDGHAYSYILPLNAVPEEDIPEKTGDPVKDSVLQFENMHEMHLVKFGTVERVNHRAIRKDFSMTADGKGESASA